MDWSKGFSAEYYMTIVDPVTFLDTERVEITGGTISRTGSGLRQSADIQCVDFDPSRECWVRVWLTAAQEDDVARVPLFTGLATAPGVEMDGMRAKYPVECYSVLKPAEDVLLPRGWFAGAGFNGAETVADLLSVSPAPIEAEDNAPILSQHIIAESGENRLTMANKILTAINWRLVIEGDGTIRICPMPLDVSGIFGVDNDVIEPRISLTSDWFGCPNVFRAVSGELSIEARDEDEDSVLSIPTRGREIWKEETSCKLNDGESLEQYAARRLAEEQAVAYSVKYSRRYNPNINVGDLVRLHYPSVGLMDIYTVKTQHINLGYGARIEEGVVK